MTPPDPRPHRPAPIPVRGFLFLSALPILAATLGLHGLTVAACAALIIAVTLHGLAAGKERS
ncbi:hypothetical protein GCM10009785_13840 [Brooklawnia cerclae]|uniref:Beta-carotene hydroxylase n=1 Tax=Brooklawnia cerclae TaxID=349934 RepID=A0ABX0SP36_9ACTN|nr:hypothetical protein [Brooklawnia cerclae]NIH58047.1 hypothetical protein [Brooklawnia cerclae]NIH58522.1 hypothetical protein [Brooklawnia cerclae]